MPDAQEVFRMATQKVRPDEGFVDRQLDRQRQQSRNRRLGAVGLAAVIGIMAAVVVIRAVDEETGTQPGGQGTDENAIPTAQPIPSLPSELLEPGRYVLSTLGDPVFDASYMVTIDVPEGYVGSNGSFVLKLQNQTQTGVSVWAIGDVYADACQWKGTLLGPSAVSSTDALAAALANQEGLRVSTPIDATVDGFAGTHMERTVPRQQYLVGCDRTQFRVWLDSGGGARSLGIDQRDLLWILDVDGVPLVIDVSLGPEASAKDRAELIQMVESVQIDPL